MLKATGTLTGKNKIFFNKAPRIPQPFLGLSLIIYKGYYFRRLRINYFVIGYRLGEFTMPRKPFKYLIKGKKKL